MRIVFLGTPLFAARTLEFLLENRVDVVAVVTQPPKPKGRSGTPVPTPVAEVARERGIDLLEPVKASAPETIEALKTYKADLFVVVAYGKILRENFLALPPKGCINVHPSLLPKYRGAAPIQRAIMNGDRVTGVTIMDVIKELDAGDMIVQEELKIGPEMTCGELEPGLCDLGARLLLKAIGQIEAGTAERTPQDEGVTTYAEKIETEDCHLDWSRSAQELHDQIRALSPRPGAWCEVKIGGKPKRMKVLRSRLAEGPDSKRLVVVCGMGHLELLEVQMEGKRPMAAQEFLRGVSSKEISFVDLNGSTA